MLETAQAQFFNLAFYQADLIEHKSRASKKFRGGILKNLRVKKAQIRSYWLSMILK